MARKAAIMAVAHRLLIIAYHVITARREPYRELGADYLSADDLRRPWTGWCGRLWQLGVEVTVSAGAPSVVPPADRLLAATP